MGIPHPHSVPENQLREKHSVQTQFDYPMEIVGEDVILSLLLSLLSSVALKASLCHWFVA